MPTIDIPDKICPHCGGTTWLIRTYKKLNLSGEPYKAHICQNEEGCFSLTKAKAREAYHKNKNIWPSRKPENHAASWRRIYHSNPIYKERQRLYEKKSSDSLDDHYVKKYMNSVIRKETGSSSRDFSQDEIIKIRTYLKALRQLKQLENEKEKQD